MKRYEVGERYEVPDGEWVKHSDALAAIEAARQEEREACAKECDARVYALDGAGDQYYRPAHADQCASAIRARGTK